jgi:GH35 family endo-1,4-beta-xylanase
MTTWGVGDAITWIGSAQAPLLFDMAYRPKPAFFAVEAALHRLVPG